MTNWEDTWFSNEKCHKSTKENSIKGFEISEDHGCWRVCIPGDPATLVALAHSMTDAVAWAHHPRMFQNPHDPYWHWTNAGEKVLLRVDRAQMLAKAILGNED
jgi:hypothetical protein